MARIVRMDQLVPPEIDFDMGDGRVFRVSGSIDMETMLRFGRLESEMWNGQEELDSLIASEAGDAEYDAATQRQMATMTTLCGEVLKVLRVHQPELEECPFSPHQIGIFLGSLRGQLDEIVGPDPTKTSPETPTRTTANRASRRASARSSG